MRLGSLGAIATSACTKPSVVPEAPAPEAGNPFVNGFHVVPPSVDLKMPPFDPFQAPFSHGPCRVSQRHAYTMSGLFGSNSRSDAPVFSSLYRTFRKLRPPSVDRKTPRASSAAHACP